MKTENIKNEFFSIFYIDNTIITVEHNYVNTKVKYNTIHYTTT